MAEMGVKVVDSGFITPRRDMEGDLPGYKPKPQLEKAPYVKDAFGFIWHWQPWMSDMGDVLAPCWDAPPGKKLIVPVGIDLEQYAKKVPEHKPPEPPPAVESAPPAEPVAVPSRRRSKAAA